jgi:hypothetical protein
MAPLAITAASLVLLAPVVTQAIQGRGESGSPDPPAAGTDPKTVTVSRVGSQPSTGWRRSATSSTGPERAPSDVVETAWPCRALAARTPQAGLSGA